MNFIDEQIQNELLLCENDAVHFIKNYFTINHPIKGEMLFGLYPFQEELIPIILNDNSIINKSRQMGITTLTAAIFLWKALFKKDQTLLVICTKQPVSINFISKIVFAYKKLPLWLTSNPKISILENINKQKIEFSYKNKIISTSGNSIREASDHIVVDEPAFIKDYYNLYTSVYPTLKGKNSKITIQSTPNGIGNLFHNQCTNAKNNLSKLKYVELPWNVHPDHDIEWFNTLCKDYNEKEIAQMFECKFLY